MYNGWFWGWNLTRVGLQSQLAKKNQNQDQRSQRTAESAYRMWRCISTPTRTSFVCRLLDDRRSLNAERHVYGKIWTTSSQRHHRCYSCRAGFGGNRRSMSSQGGGVIHCHTLSLLSYTVCSRVGFARFDASRRGKNGLKSSRQKHEGVSRSGA